MFPRVNPLGWAFLEILTSTQMNQLDTNVSRALDGLNGGTYTLAVMLELAGAGVKFSDVAQFNAAAVDFVGCTVNVDGGSTWTFNSAVLFNNLVAFAAGAIVPSGQTVALQSGATLNNNVGGTIANQGYVNNTGVIENTGGGQFRRRWLHLNDADQTFSAADADVFYIPIVGSPHTYTLSNTGSGDNTEIEVRQDEADLTAGHTLIYPGGTVVFGATGTDNAKKIAYLRRIPSSSLWMAWWARYGPN